MRTYAERYHDISVGHRVAGHESKCQHLHGHNYRVSFSIEAQALDKVGRVIDFSVIKMVLCEWLEENWDHKFLLWEKDPILEEEKTRDVFLNKVTGVVLVPFNPTAENMAAYILTTVAPALLQELNVELVSVVIEETRKCQVKCSL